MAGSIILLILVAILVVASLSGILLARIWRVREATTGLVVLLLCCLAGVVVTAVGWPPRTGIDLRGGTLLLYQIQADVPLAQRAEAQQQNPQGPEAAQPGLENLIAAVTRRVNPGGVKEVTIRPYGTNQLEILVPETDEEQIARLKRILGRPGALEFHILANQRDDKTLIERAVADNGTELRAEQGRPLAQWVPVAKGQEEILRRYSEIAVRTVKRGAEEITEVLVVNDDSHATGAYLLQAVAGIGRLGHPSVQYLLDTTGGRHLAALTANKQPDKVGSFTRKLGIILDGRLVSAPPITEPLSQTGEISGNFTEQELKDLADVLGAGTLPKALSPEPVAQRTTGPTLGLDTVHRGAIALGVALVLVFALLLVIYRFAGLVACGTLLVDLLLIAAIVTIIKLALTLPALAGVLLVFAAATSAHILIFERIREELDRQTPLRMAIRNGFSKAQSAILDAGAAILIMASVLFLLGTEQIKVFAATLWLGTALSWVTAVYCSRIVFDVAERRRWFTQLSMLRLPIPANVDFLKKQSVAAIISTLAVVLSVTGLYFVGPNLWSVDFAGGSTVEAVFKQPQAIVEVRRGLAAMPGVSVYDLQAAGDMPGLRYRVISPKPAGQSAEEHLKEVQATLRRVFGDKLAEPARPAAERTPLLSANTIGGKVARSTQEYAAYALLVSLLGIVGYLWLRFQKAYYPLATTVALAHDVLITLGVIALSHYVAPYLGFLRIEPFRIGLPVAIALVTVAGYSLMGTIFVLDRIREARGKSPLLSDDKVNAGLNQSLGRALVTALAMLLVALTLYVAGAPAVQGFALTFLVGVLVAGYSSIYIAPSFLLWMSRPAVTVPAPAPVAPTPQRASKGKR